MPRIRLWCLLTAVFLVVACRPESVGPAVDPRNATAIAVPTHVLTEDRAGTVVEAEAGDWIEVHLPDPDAPMEWEPQSARGLEIEGPSTGEVRDSEQGPLRVFRYLTREVGHFGLSFELTSSESDGPPARTLEFTVAVR